MNIEKLFGKKNQEEKKKYSSSIRRSVAAAIDISIVLLLRIFVMQILGYLWVNAELTRFMIEFENYFGTMTVKGTPEHIQFIVNHRIFPCLLIFYAIIIFVGALYHALLNSSSWYGTMGKRAMKIVLVKEDGSRRINFGLGMAHYFLSVLPFVYIFYLLGFQVKNKVTLFQAITTSDINVFFGIVFLIWIHAHVFTRKKVTAYDMICRTVVLNGKTDAKFPWTKV